MKNFYFFKTLLLAVAILGFTQLNAQVVITDADGLNDMRNDAAGSYILGNDIDLSGFTWVPFEFTGELDGAGFSVKNLDLELPEENLGLFSVLNGATITNLGIEDVFVYSNNASGALAGKALNSTITKTFATGEVGSGGQTGGLVGFSEETDFHECYTIMDVDGRDHVGGIVGHMNGGTVENCMTNSNVYSEAWQVGGLVGWAQNAGAVITKSVAYGTVKSVYGFTGGILGIADGAELTVAINECIAMQTLLETTEPDIDKTFRIIANHAAGDYSNNYGLADITLVDPHKTEWENDVDGKDGASITMEQATSADFFADSLNWDFESVWRLTENGPELMIMPMEAVLITSAQELSDIRNNDSGSYKLANDIDLSGFTWEPFEFYGELDGNGFSVKNLDIELPQENLGLFSVLNGATISNLGVEDVYVYSNNASGALAGRALNSTITKTFATGEVGSGGQTGGLVGFSEETHFHECYTIMDVNGRDHVGGIVGHMNGGTVENCMTHSNVYSEAWQVGGLVGWAQNAGASITKSVAYGTVRSVYGFTGGILGIADGGEPVVVINECIAMQTLLETTEPDIDKTFRIIANHAAGDYSNNYGLGSITLSDPNKTEWENDVDGKDGASITLEQATSADFYADSLTWDFDNVWRLTDIGPILQFAPASTNVREIDPSSLTSNIKVFNRYGDIVIEGAAENTLISVYNITGALVYRGLIQSTTHTISGIKGLSVVVVEGEKKSAHKVVTF
jgi:hypothetical protein